MKSLPPRHVHGVLLRQFVNLCLRGMQNISFFTLWLWRFAATLLELRACPAQACPAAAAAAFGWHVLRMREAGSSEHGPLSNNHSFSGKHGVLAALE